MDVITVIKNLWLAENLPIRDGLYRAAGMSRTVRIDPTVPGGLVVLESFDLDAFLRADPEWLTAIDVLVRQTLPDGSGYLCGGEGSYGSEGFFGRLDRHQELVWVVYLQRSNPITEIAVDGEHATFTSSSGLSITVDLTSPEFDLDPTPYERGTCDHG